MPAQRFEMGRDAAAVPSARRSVVGVLRGHVPDDVVEASELVTSELVGNALLHAEAPIVLVVGPGRDAAGVRIEVHDGSRTLPVRSRSSTRPVEQGLAGRGLGLIDALAAGWGVEVTAHGKVVWVELTPVSVSTEEAGADLDLDHLRGALQDRTQSEVPQYTVTLLDVPTDLLLAVNEHVESMVRELTLTTTGARSGVSAALPPHLAGLADDLALAWAGVRQSIKRQAVAAAERGEQRTTLTLWLPLSAADDGERYLSALEQADSHGRASRLLTLAAPPQHRAFHRWYVTSLVDVLRRSAAGERGVVPPSFESHLLREIDQLATLQQVSARSARLQRVSAALSGALSPAAVAETVLAEAVADLGALRGVLLVPTVDGTASRVVASIGCSPELLVATTVAWSEQGRTPCAVAWASSAAVWLEAPGRSDVVRCEPDAGAVCVVPLQVGGQDVGLLSLTFLDSRLFTDDERAFLRALTAVAAQALERAALHQQQTELAAAHDVAVREQAERAREQAAARLALLAEATHELVGALDTGELLSRITTVLVPALGQWAIAGLLDDEGRVRDARGVHADPTRTALLERLVHDRPYALESVPRVSRVLATGVGELVAGANGPAPAGVDDEVARLVSHLGYGSAIVVPLIAAQTVLGVICVLGAPDRAPFTVDDLATASDIGSRAGLAVQNAQLFERQRTAVEVLQRSMLTALPQPESLQLTARYLAAGEQAQVGGDWYDAFLQPDGATVLVIGDVIGHDTVAAAAMGQLRSLLRGTSYDRLESPARVLARVDGALRGLRIDTLATALVARLEQSPEQQVNGVRTLRWSSAGHPPAVLRTADGRARLLDEQADLLLGFDPDTERHDHVVEMAEGDTLLLYTDGLVERRDSDLSTGIELLRETLVDLGGLPLEELCDGLLVRLLPDRADDDVALVVLRVRPAASAN